MSNQPSLLKHANKLRFFPCVSNDKKPACMWKDVATGDPVKLEALFKGKSRANVGMVVPKELMVLDVDSKAGKMGAQSLETLEKIYGQLPKCPTQRTASGGLHLVFKLPEGVEVKNSAGKVGKDLDIRSGGTGFIVVEPSTINGGKYEWIIDSPMAEGEWNPPIAPEWLINLAIGEASSIKAPKIIASRVIMQVDNQDIAQIRGVLATIPPDKAEEYDSWFKVGLALSHGFNGSERGLSLWTEWSQQASNYADGVCAAKWASFTPDQTNGVTISSLYYLAKPPALNDEGLVARLIQMLGDKMKYCPAFGWVRFRG